MIPSFRSGLLVTDLGASATDQGALVYLNGGEDLAKPLSRVEKSGGTVLMPKTSIGENGYMAIFKKVSDFVFLACFLL